MIRGHLKGCVLSALKDKERTGYDLIKYIAERTGWKPSYGSIYPLLEHLTEEKLVVFNKKEKKKIYQLTDKGKKELTNLSIKKQDLINKMEEAAKIFETLYKFKLGKYQTKMMEMMKRGELDITDMPEEALRMKEIVSKLSVKKKIKEHKEEINQIFKKANEELLKIK